MARAELTVDLDAVRRNWLAIDRLSAPDVETGAVLKAGAYGLGMAPIARSLARTGVRSFFVALAEEGAQLRQMVDDAATIFILSGHMDGDGAILARHRLVPAINSRRQFDRHRSELPDAPYAFQLDTGMNRLGLEPDEFKAIRAQVQDLRPALVISHLACADDPSDPMNECQLAVFRELTEGLECKRSLAATGGILLGESYHFDLVRPGIGLFGGQPFAQAEAVVRLDLPVIQTRKLGAGETVGYGATWSADQTALIATLSAGYADGIFRRLGNRAHVFAGSTPCPIAGRVSMDLVGVDVTHLDQVPDHLSLLCPQQTIDHLADTAETIGYEILTSLGRRYAVRYHSDRGGSDRC